VVRGGDAARGGRAGAAAAPLPPVDGAPGAETVHGAGSPVGSGPPGGRGAEMARRGGVGGRWGRARSRRRWSFQFFFAFLQFTPRLFVKFELEQLAYHFLVAHSIPRSPKSYGGDILCL
jgi:hypothetical protein